MKPIRIVLLFSILISFSLHTQAEETTHTKILVNLWEHKLSLIKDGKTVEQFPVGPGTDKTPSPVGQFKVVKKQKNWGSGFGTRWMGLSVPWGKYGIHGTNRPYMIGQSVSHGCVRMHNKDVEKLYPQVPVGTPVIIDGPITGKGDWAFRNLSVGSKGSLVMLVQNHLRAAGIYDGPEDGIYGEEMKAAVKEFQKRRGLPTTGGISRAVYIELGLLE